MTGTEVSVKALEMFNNRDKYCYLYGGKGESIVALEDVWVFFTNYPDYYKKYTVGQKDMIADDALGKTAYDCSGFVCYCGNQPERNSKGIIDSCLPTTISDWGFDGHGTAGTVLWKEGHIGINRGDGTFIHMAKELGGIEVGKISEYDWTVCGKLPGVDYSRP